MKRIKLLALSIAGITLLSGCNSSDSGGGEIQDGSLDDLYQAAQEEGSLTIYGPTEDLYAEIYKDFSEEYPGIEIVTSDIFGQELDSRLEGELAAGGFEADLVHIGVSDVERYNEKEYLATFRALDTEELPEEFVGPDDKWSVPSQHLYAPAYNTNNLSEDEVPTTWEELASNDLAGKIATANPKQSGVTPQVLSAAFAADVIDEQWLDNFKNDAQPLIMPSVANALQTTVTGETDISLVAGFGTYARQIDEGAPLALAPLSDGVYFSDVAYAALEDSPNPNAARLLVSWMYSETGQAAIAEHVYEFGTMPDAPEPKGAEALGDLDTITYPGAEKYREMLDLLNSKF